MTSSAPKPLCARDVGDVGHIEHPDRAHHGVELMLVTVVGHHRPAPPDIGPSHSGNLGVGLQMWAHPVVVGYLLQIGQDLGLVGIGLAPPRVERKRIRVQVRRDVAGCAREGVVSPGPAESVGAVKDGEVVAGRGGLDPHRDAPGARADDADGDFRGHQAPDCAKYGRSGRLFPPG